MTIEDAINLHKCMDEVEENIGDDIRHASVASCDDVKIEYEVVDFEKVEIKSVSFGQLKSEKSKNLIQEYFDNQWQE